MPETLWDALELTADEPPIFALHNVKIEGRGGSLWITSADGTPLPSKRCSITYSMFSFVTEGARLAFGSRANLEESDAYVKVVTAE